MAWMTWSFWLLLGLGLLVLEILTPGGFVSFFFGVSALVVAGLSALHIFPLWLEWLIFAALSVGMLVLLRRPLRQGLQARTHIHVDSLVGEIGILLEDLPASEIGKIEIRGSPWNVRNVNGAALPRGQRCKVARIEGLLLWVHPE
jgi:membrane protein implicated in regulation of membrane protease activity